VTEISGGRLTVLLLLGLLLGLIPATVAQRKGQSFVGYWLFGVVLFPFALVVALLLPTLDQPSRSD
jgi:hypothetical protein